MAVLLWLSGCSVLVSDPRALEPMEGFSPLPGDKRVLVEDRADFQAARAYGRRVSVLLDGAIAKVEHAMYQPFAETPRIYVCVTQECFDEYVYTPGLVAAVIPDNRLVLSPQLNENERDRLKGILIHELAHLHLGQRAGHYHYSIPVWFHEGWASLIADGGGAEYATDAQALEAAREGNAINPALRDTPNTRHVAGAHGLDIHIFYRQAMLLVAALKKRNEAQFRQLALALERGDDFGIAFWDIYGSGPETVLADALVPDIIQGNNAAAPSAPIINSTGI